jgi:hypothetical protein
MSDFERYLKIAGEQPTINDLPRSGRAAEVRRLRDALLAVDRLLAAVDAALGLGDHDAAVRSFDAARERIAAALA